MDYYYMSAKNKKDSKDKIEAKQQLWSVNLDLLVEANIPKTYAYIGGFVGAGFGQIYYDAQYYIDSLFGYFGYYGYLNLKMKQLFLNFGVALTFGAKHRLEFYYKIPTSDELNNKENSLYWTTHSLMSFVYQYTF